MSAIFTTVGLAVDAANRRAKAVSLDFTGVRILAVVTHDRSGVFLAWATSEQTLAENETEVGSWMNGVDMGKRT